MLEMINKKWDSLKRRIFIMSCMVVLVGVIFMGSVAYLQKISGLGNQFEIGKTDIMVEEFFDDSKTRKTDIRLVNEGNTAVYMRAKLLIYYVDVDNNVLDDIPKEGIDYTIEEGSSDWIKKEDIYYYKAPVEPYSNDGSIGKTTNIITCIDDLMPNDNKYLVVDVIGESIQATPLSAVKEAWEVTINNETGHIENISVKEEG